MDGRCRKCQDLRVDYRDHTPRTLGYYNIEIVRISELFSNVGDIFLPGATRQESRLDFIDDQPIDMAQQCIGDVRSWREVEKYRRAQMFRTLRQPQVLLNRDFLL